MAPRSTEVRPVRELSLCTGIGGITLGLKLVVGGIRAVCYVEREAYPAAALVARMEDKTLDEAPIWDDLVTFPSADWRGAVDLVTAGFPCQPFSVAGKHLGTEDERWLWPDIVRIIRDLRPRFVFLENVPGLIKHGLTELLTDLAELGFDVEWDLFAATNIGAPHRRRRVFILAHTNGQRLEEQWWPPLKLEELRSPAFHGVQVAHALHHRCEVCGKAYDDDGRDDDGHVHDRCFEGTVGIWPPGPTEAERWIEVLGVRPDLSPAVDDGLQGRHGASEGQVRSGRDTPEQSSERAALSPVRGMVDGLSHRVERLRTLGNSVVPPMVAYAWCVLAARARARRRCPGCAANGVVRIFEPELLEKARARGRKITCSSCMKRYKPEEL